MASREKVNHPDHYGGKDNPYEAIKVIEAWQFPAHIAFHLGSMLKYLSRAGKKEGELRSVDLRKIEWYAKRAVEENNRYEAEVEKRVSREVVEDLQASRPLPGSAEYTRCLWELRGPHRTEVANTLQSTLPGDTSAHQRMHSLLFGTWAAAYRVEQLVAHEDWLLEGYLHTPRSALVERIYEDAALQGWDIREALTKPKGVRRGAIGYLYHKLLLQTSSGVARVGYDVLLDYIHNLSKGLRILDRAREVEASSTPPEAEQSAFDTLPT